MTTTVTELCISERFRGPPGTANGGVACGSLAVAPSLYGIVGDAVGVTAALGVVAGVVLVTIPLCLALRPALGAPAGASLG